VLEIAVGTGRNLAFYPAEARLIAIDMSPSMLAVARRRALEIGRPVDLRQANAESLPFSDKSFDSVMCTLSFCCIPDPDRAIAESARVLRPGGKLVMVEHVRSPVWLVRTIQHVLEPISVRFQADHLVRDPLDYISQADFQIQHLERTKWGVIERLVAQKHTAPLT
jgi:ubiquinone/menaquinone biosynthesis C-methylase UbiE